MRRAKKQERMIHTQEKKKLIEMDSEWAQNVSLANKILKTYYKYIQKKENKMIVTQQVKIQIEKTIKRTKWNFED